MASVAEIVANEITTQKMAALADIESQRIKAQAQINDADNAVTAKLRELTNDFIGFRTGLRPPAFMTQNANALSYDPLYGVDNAPPPSSSKPALSIGALAVIVGLLYLVTRKGKKR